MLHTEETVRAGIRVKDGSRVYYLPEGDRLTPSARDWLRNENVRILRPQDAPPKVYTTLSGGTLTVWTANTADNQALDADGTITVSGGTVFAAGGSAGMGMTLSASQPYVTFGTQASQPGQGGRQQIAVIQEDHSADQHSGTQNHKIPQAPKPEVCLGFQILRVKIGFHFIASLTLALLS